MDELDEVSRRALLIEARKALEKEYQQAEADKKALDTQIDAKRKELRDLLERVDAATLQSELELKRIADETVREREKIQSRNDTLRIELSRLQALRNQEEAASQKTLDDLRAKIEERRTALVDVANRVVQEEAKLKVCEASLSAIKRTLEKGGL